MSLDKGSIRHIPPADTFLAWKESKRRPSKLRRIIWYAFLYLALLTIPFIAWILLAAWSLWTISRGGWLD